MRASADERTSLLAANEALREANDDAVLGDNQDEDSAVPFDVTPYYKLLPLALLAALAIAATSATSVFAYASLLCRDPRHCGDDERGVYAGAVALATTLANICGLLLLGPLERISRKSQTRGLMLWLVCRSSSVLLLALGVSLGSIHVALSGKIFEGLASDNILHFNLNAAYAQVPHQGTVTKLIGGSLGLYMIGISISPMIAGTFSHFTASFTFALAMFGAFFIYLMLAVDSRTAGQRAAANAARKGTESDDSLEDHSSVRDESSANAKGSESWRSSLTPLKPLWYEPLAILPALSLLVYNTGQSYVFEGIMVYTTTEFGFTGLENGCLISIVHAAAAAYMFTVLFLAPQLRRKLSSRNDNHSSVHNKASSNGGFLALISLTVNGIFLVALARSRSEAQLYELMPLFSVGLVASGFIKAAFVALFPPEEGPPAVAALAVVETSGALMSPAVLGAIQALWPGRLALLAAAGMMGTAAVIYGVGLVFARIRKREHRTGGEEYH